MITPQDSNAAEHGPNLEQLVEGTSIEAALSFYDSLPPVAIEEMLGAWKGTGVPTGNPLDGLLEALGWHGKRFDSADACHPLVFDTPRGLVSVNAAVVPLRIAMRCLPALRNPLVIGALRLIRPALGTRRPKARLRMMQYRGVVTGTLSYDDLPIHDAFRRVDDDTLLGAMDLRGLDQPFLFLLRRENAAAEVDR